MNEIEIARMLNVRYDNKDGRVFIEMEVTDPAWKSKIMRDWEKLEVRLVVDEEEE